MLQRNWKRMTLIAVVASLFATTLGFGLARNSPDNASARSLRVKCDELQRYSQILRKQLGEVTAELEDLKRLGRKSGGERVGHAPPLISAVGWLNDSSGIVERLEGKVIVLDVWADW